MQAYLSVAHGKDVAKFIGDIYEKWNNYTESQSAKEYNMDSWNNDIGRQIGTQIKNETSHFNDITTQKMYEDMIAERIFEKIKNGELITNPKDSRRYQDLKQGKPTDQAVNIREYTPPYTRGDIKSMTSDEFSHYEKSIMSEMEKGKIIDDTRPTAKIYVNKKSSSTKSLSSSFGDGKWVTINGNHVLIKD